MLYYRNCNPDSALYLAYFNGIEPFELRSDDQTLGKVWKWILKVTATVIYIAMIVDRFHAKDVTRHSNPKGAIQLSNLTYDPRVYICSPAKGGARSRWLTPQPDMESPDRPTAAKVSSTEAKILQRIKLRITKQTAGPMNPAIMKE
jgi:hypothetical protein